MFHKAKGLEYKEGTTLQVSFQDGKTVKYDMSDLFGKYPQLEALRDRDLFESGKLMGSYGIIWNDDLDIEVETIYEEGIEVKKAGVSTMDSMGWRIYTARENSKMTQKELAKKTGIDQSDISKIERGAANPSVATLERIASALDAKLTINLEKEETESYIEKLRLKTEPKWKVIIPEPFENCEKVHPLQQNKVSRLIKDALKNAAVKEIYIFGSSVTNRCHIGSDVDVYMIMDEDINPVTEKYEFKIDFWNNFRVDHRLEAEILRKGIKVYG